MSNGGDLEDTLIFKKIDRSVFFYGFIIPPILGVIIHIFFSENLYRYFFDEGPVFLSYLFSGIINALKNHSDSYMMSLNVLGVMVFGFPIECLYWFMLGPREVERGRVKLAIIFKVALWISVLLLIFVIFCSLNNVVTSNGRVARLDKIVSNHFFFLMFVLMPINFFSLCFSVLFRLILICLRER